jgi:hypothetical protein
LSVQLGFRLRLRVAFEPARDGALTDLDSVLAEENGYRAQPFALTAQRPQRLGIRIQL